MNVMNKIIENINSQIRDNEIRKIDICRNTGMSKTTLWRILTGRTDPTISQIEKIQNYINSLNN